MNDTMYMLTACLFLIKLIKIHKTHNVYYSWPFLLASIVHPLMSSSQTPTVQTFSSLIEPIE